MRDDNFGKDLPLKHQLYLLITNKIFISGLLFLGIAFLLFFLEESFPESSDKIIILIIPSVLLIIGFFQTYRRVSILQNPNKIIHGRFLGKIDFPSPMWNRSGDMFLRISVDFEIDSNVISKHFYFVSQSLITNNYNFFLVVSINTRKVILLNRLPKLVRDYIIG